jgi:hypothetical protein
VSPSRSPGRRRGRGDAVEQQLEEGHAAVATVGRAVAGPDDPANVDTAVVGDTEVREPDRLVGRAAVRPGALTAP